MAARAGKCQCGQLVVLYYRERDGRFLYEGMCEGGHTIRRFAKAPTSAMPDIDPAAELSPPTRRRPSARKKATAAVSASPPKLPAQASFRPPGTSPAKPPTKPRRRKPKTPALSELSAQSEEEDDELEPQIRTIVRHANHYVNDQEDETLDGKEIALANAQKRRLRATSMPQGNVEFF
jgi:hypothetical protein